MEGGGGGANTGKRAAHTHTSVVHQGPPLTRACTPCGTMDASCSKELWMSDDHSTTPKRAPPAHRPRVSTSGASPSSATGREKVFSQEFTHSWLKAAAGPKLVSYPCGGQPSVPSPSVSSSQYALTPCA